uniref:CX domain-containing protein n=1 Tax=Globodera rostochiensis TaxID=31243 RepID=A0A914GR67_GLORO
MGWSSKKGWVIVLIVSLISEPFVFCKRSGTYGSSRGGSPSRGSSLRSRISSAFGRNSGSSYSRGGYGGRDGGGGLTGRLFGHKNRHNYGGSNHYGAANRGSGGGLLGGGGRGAVGGGLLGGGLLGGLSRSRHRGLGGGGYRNSGMGSRSRSNTFKNMVVGAAAGYLTYKAGKAIIRNVAAPMMWNNRQYYWGPQYYPSSPRGHGIGGNSRTMCRMPIDPNDPVLGQVYMPDNSRPKEIVWSCEYHEECCGNECCARGMVGGHGGY